MTTLDKDQWLVGICVVAALGFTFYVEHDLATETLKVPWMLAILFPVVLDTYVLAAMRAGADRFWAFGLSAIAQGSAGWAAITPPDDGTKGLLRAVFGVSVTLVLWRVHELQRAVVAKQVVPVVAEDPLPIPVEVVTETPEDRPVPKPVTARKLTVLKTPDEDQRFEKARQIVEAHLDQTGTYLGKVKLAEALGKAGFKTGAETARKYLAQIKETNEPEVAHG